MLTYYPSRFPDPRVTGSGYARLNVLTRFEKKGSGILDKHPGSVTLGDWATSSHHFVQCCGSGSGIRDWVPFWPLDPGWEKVSIRIRDPGWTIRIIIFKALKPFFFAFLRVFGTLTKFCLCHCYRCQFQLALLHLQGGLGKTPRIHWTARATASEEVSASF
jgi:hypothetical protein